MKSNQDVGRLRGGNMDIDLLSNAEIDWEQDRCPWNAHEGSDQHKCAVKNVSICGYFRGVEYPDVILCAYPANLGHNDS